MSRSKKTQKESNIQGQSFDLVLDFDGSVNPQLFMDEDTAYILSELVKKHKHFRLRINWWNPALLLEFPDASTTPSERISALMDTYLNMYKDAPNKSA
jgi:hypothetical protein